MAYTFFPQSATEIKQTLKTGDKLKIDEIIRVYTFLSGKFKKVKSPINIDPKAIGKINVSRELQGSVDLATIKRQAKVVRITMKFGSGSSGNRGVANRGNLFEPMFAEALREWWNGDKIKDQSILNAIETIATTYKLTAWNDFQVEDVGELNNKRPLIYSPSVLISSQIPVTNNNLGPIVTDITLSNGPKGKKKVYLSLKLGGTVTFFNVGIRTVLTPAEIKSGTITNKNGLKILDMFNIQPELFCDIFNGKLKKGYSEDIWPTMSSTQKKNLKLLLESGIGHGYFVVHKLTKGIKTIEIDEAYMRSAATPTSCMVYYGGKTGTAKRIDMEIETGKYILKLNIRDTQGGDGYPTRMMCDFSYL
jgi:hypothetical protein